LHFSNFNKVLCRYIEAVNFAPPDWLRFGLDGVERYRFYRKPSVLCHDELLCAAAAGGCTS
jgi:histone demethylase JARID1